MTLLFFGDALQGSGLTGAADFPGIPRHCLRPLRIEIHCRKK